MESQKFELAAGLIAPPQSSPRHNTENIIPLDKALHSDVSAFYSLIRRDITGSPLTVRQWLSMQSYEDQRDFGLLAIKNIGKGLW
jgi:hypothetical protein